MNKIDNVIKAALAALLCCFFLPTVADCQSVKRIKSIAFNKAKVEKIFVAQGLSTLVTFNCDINEMISGNKQQVTLEGLQTNKKQMKITLAQGAAQPTNIFVKCGQKLDPYIFDIVPSKTNHQDYLKINVSYGEPEEEADSNQALSKVPKKHKPVVIEVKKPEQIKESDIDKLKNKTREESAKPKRETLEELLKQDKK